MTAAVSIYSVERLAGKFGKRPTSARH